MKIMNVNNEKMKQINLSTVFNAVRQNEPISRKNLAQMTGLTSSSITNIVNELLEREYLKETGLGESSGGRKPIMLQLNQNAGYVIGLELTTNYIAGIVTNLKAKKIYKLTVNIDRLSGEKIIIDQMIGLIDKLIYKTEIPKDKIIGIGIAAPGPYNHKKGILINPPNFPGLVNVPLRDIVHEHFKVPVFLEKETVAAALGEYWFGGAQDINNLFVINSMKIGIGGGALIDGKIYHGFRDGAGEIGHMMIDIDGPKCTCGNYGCLEAMASGLYMKNSAIYEIKGGTDTILTEIVQDIEKLTVDQIIAASNKGDKLSKQIVHKTARNLGLGIYNIINLYSPEMIVIGGDLALECPEYLEKAVSFARKKIYLQHSKDIRIVPTSFGSDMGVIGAVSVVFQDFFKNIN